MNLIQQAEQLKNLPDQALAQMQQRPTDTPPYLVVAEMQRRANMRKAYQGAQQSAPPNQPPVAQQMAQQMQQQATPPMQMAGGGLASLARYYDGGVVGPRINPTMLSMASFPGYIDPPSEEESDLSGYYASMSAPPDVDPTMLSMMQLPGDPRWNDMRKFKSAIPDVREHSEYAADMEATSGGTLLKNLADRYEKEESDLRGKKPSISQILMQLGLGMAASRRPDFAGAIGEGGLHALQGYTQERNRTQTLADRIAEKRLRALEGVQRHNDRINDLAIDARRGDIAARNTITAGNNAIELSIMRQQGADEQAIAMAERDFARQQAAMDLAEQKASAEYSRRMDEKEYDRQTQLEVQGLRNAGRGSGRGRQRAEERPVNPIDAVKAYNSMADDYDRQVVDMSKDLYTTPLAQRKELQDRIDAIKQQASQMRAVSINILKKVLPMGDAPPPPPPPPPPPKSSKMTAENYLRSLPK